MRCNKPIEVTRHARRVERFLRPRMTDRILEIGCGRGFLTQRIQRVARATTGIDLNPQAIANAVTGDLHNMDARSLAFADAAFDKIYSFHAIEHIPDLGLAFREMDRVLKPGGRLLLVYPAEPIRGLYVVPTAIVLFGNPLRARDLHVHKLSPRRLRRFLAGTSFRVVRSTLDLLLTPQFITVLRKGQPATAHRAPRPARELEAAEVT
ncbi:MAG TPA: methyltransferase domain-containing protein [Gemmatimonadaceae bacterium]